VIPTEIGLRRHPLRAQRRRRHGGTCRGAGTHLRRCGTAIWEHEDGTAWFSTDQPGSHFSSLDIPEVTQVGLELDRKFAALLKTLDVEVPAVLGH
jgi:hypothetical protein